MPEAAPAAPAAEPVAPAAPEPGAPPAEPAAPAATAEPAPGGEPAAPETTPGPGEGPNFTGEFRKRLDREVSAKWQERRRAEAAESRARQLEEDLRSARGGPDPSPAAPAAPAVPGARDHTDPAVLAAAAQLVHQQRFTERCNVTYDRGRAEVKDFEQALKGFEPFGGITAHPAIVAAAIELDNGHQVLAHLGTHAEEAERVLNLPPLAQAVEVAKIGAKLATSRAPAVTRTPDPIQPTRPAAPSEPAGPDDKGDFKSQADYRAWRKKQFRQR